MGTVMDVTLRKHWEETLRSSEERYRSFFENTQSLMCTHNLDGILLSVNKAAADNLKTTVLKMVGTSIYSILSPGTRDSFYEYLAKIQEEKSVKGLMKVMSSEGEERIWSYHNYLYEPKGGEPYIVGSAQDVTDRILADKELAKAKKQAEESMKEKEMFLANMSHEIRTPMHGIIGLANILLQSENLTHQQLEYLDALKKSAGNLLVIINDILDFSKIEAGKMVFERKEFSVTEISNTIHKLFEEKISEKKIKLMVETDEGIPAILCGDAVRLNQVLINLVGNAVKFTSEGYVKLAITNAGEDNNSITLNFSVEDTGIGIPKEKTGTIFESFGQASSDTARKFGGTGLGLAISRKLVEGQGGLLQVESIEGTGSRFYFSLRYGKQAPAKNDSQQNPAAGEPEVVKRVRLLAAEDNPINQLLLKKLASDLGFFIEIAGNGADALRKLENENYDVVLLDVCMPQMNGYETTRRIRCHSSRDIRNLPVLAMTASAFPEEREQCLRTGMNDFISKPFDLEELKSKIVAAMRKEAPAETTSVPNRTNIEEMKKTLNGHAVDLTYLKTVSRGNEKFMISTIELFIEKIIPHITAMEQEYEQGNLGKVKEIAHKIGPSINSVGCKALCEIVQQIEKAARIGKKESIGTLIKAMTPVADYSLCVLNKELDAMKCKN
jgi:PAS domain S-box-containing protein